MLRRTTFERSILLSLLALGACAEAPVEVSGPSIVLVTVDTLRADRLGCYGYPRATSPFLDELAERSLVFERVYANSSLTLPSHGAIMTSRYPVESGLVLNQATLDGKLLTIAEALRQRGYDTAGFTSVTFLEELGRGFETFDFDSDYEPPFPYRHARVTVDHAVEWLEGRSPGRPFFLWIHLYDPHQPQMVPNDVLDTMRVESAAELRELTEFWRSRQRLHPEPFGDLEGFVAENLAYDAEIRYVDDELRRLHDAIGAEGEPTAWIITADHGEGLGAHGYRFHEERVYQEQLHVPLILHVPSDPVRTGRETGIGSLLDVAPTIAELAGIGFPGRGDSLLNTAANPGSEVSPWLFAQTMIRVRNRKEDVLLRAVQTRDLKYIVHSDGNEEFYDLARDPVELSDLAGCPSPRLGTMRARMTMINEELSLSSSDVSLRVDEELEEELRSLGYLD